MADMNEVVNSVLDAALKLSGADRARIAAELLASLDGVPEADADACWAAEVEKREADVRTGVARMVPWEEVKAEVNEALRRR